LPLDVPDFTGRAEALATLDALVEDGRRDFSPMTVSITGMPGVGRPRWPSAKISAARSGATFDLFYRHIPKALKHI
jgi:hypothetical protein